MSKVKKFKAFTIRKVPSFFALGFGVEKWNCYKFGMTWHAKVYLGPYVVLVYPQKFVSFVKRTQEDKTDAPDAA